MRISVEGIGGLVIDRLLDQLLRIGINADA